MEKVLCYCEQISCSDNSRDWKIQRTFLAKDGISIPTLHDKSETLRDSVLKDGYLGIGDVQSFRVYVFGLSAKSGLVKADYSGV